MAMEGHDGVGLVPKSLFGVPFLMLHTQSAPFGLCPKGLMLTQAPSSIMRSRNSRDHTMNSGRSCLSASTMAIPTINDSSAAMSACSTISARKGLMDKPMERLSTIDGKATCGSPSITRSSTCGGPRIQGNSRGE
ncbi:hypothetical protein P7K49_013616 [Saguinus oedipus]|uniref:Uncharacterized protein n=1 Tax=Saguinus oedipus TaxID=9490 RepID=A0ABQ9VGM0_SAGOE|nr:hypothetical protein P7K49_013616 [Saguinus oedipus]